MWLGCGAAAGGSTHCLPTLLGCSSARTSGFGVSLALLGHHGPVCSK
jgi:hypothetical protein